MLHFGICDVNKFQAYYPFFTVVLVLYIRASEIIHNSTLKIHALGTMYPHFPHPWQPLFQLSISESISLDPTYE